MFGTHFYHRRVRKSVAVFGSLFNNIYVLRKNSSGNVISSVKVPLSYAPKDKFIERVREVPDLREDTRVAIKLPRMSFEIIAFDYDAQRQLQKTNAYSRQGSANTAREKFFVPVPYNINFQLNVYAKTQDDALQIVEQIVPYFNPQYTLTVKPFDKFPSIKEDTPVILNGITFSDDFEGSQEQRRTIIYTLDFTMKIQFHGPNSTTDIIRQVDVNLGIKGGGLNDSDVLTERIRVVPNPTDVNPDSDFGFDDSDFTTSITILSDSA